MWGYVREGVSGYVSEGVSGYISEGECAYVGEKVCVSVSTQRACCVVLCCDMLCCVVHVLVERLLPGAKQKDPRICTTAEGDLRQGIRGEGRRGGEQEGKGVEVCDSDS